MRNPICLSSSGHNLRIHGGRATVAPFRIEDKKRKEDKKKAGAMRPSEACVPPWYTAR